MKKIIHYVKNFINDNAGMETLEIGAIAVGAVVLIGVLVEIYNASGDKLAEARENISVSLVPEE